MGMVPAQALQRLFPQPQAWQTGRDDRLLGVEPYYADVVGDNSVAVIVKPGRKG